MSMTLGSNIGCSLKPSELPPLSAALAPAHALAFRGDVSSAESCWEVPPSFPLCPLNPPGLLPLLSDEEDGEEEEWWEEEWWEEEYSASSVEFRNGMSDVRISFMLRMKPVNTR